MTLTCTRTHRFCQSSSPYMTDSRAHTKNSLTHSLSLTHCLSSLFLSRTHTHTHTHTHKTHMHTHTHTHKTHMHTHAHTQNTLNQHTRTHTRLQQNDLQTLHESTSTFIHPPFFFQTGGVGRTADAQDQPHCKSSFSFVPFFFSCKIFIQTCTALKLSSHHTLVY